jgi:hypothetical protein
MKLRYLLAPAAIFVAGLGTAALADLNYTAGTGTVIFDFLCFTTKHCSAHVNIKNDGTEIFTSGNPGQVTIAGGLLSPGPAAGAGSAPVVLATDQGAADACMFKAKTNLAISQNGTASVQLIALSGSTVIHVCSLALIAAGATTVAITTGTGTACVTGNAAVIGSTTANIANSMSLAANGGLTLGNGQGTIAKGAAASELCMILGTNVFVSGNLTYVQQ